VEGDVFAMSVTVQVLSERTTVDSGGSCDNAEAMLRAGVALVALVALVAGCGGSEKSEPPGGPPPAVEAAPAPPRSCEPGLRPLGSLRRSYAAVVASAPTRAYRRPGGKPFADFGRLNVNGVPTVFGVLGKVVDARCRARWYRVQLPLRPNGRTGFVRATDVQLAAVRTRIHVDLSERRVTLFRDGKRVLHAVAAVGSPATPTPTGRFYVNQRLVPEDASGPFGPAAVGISAFSEVLTGWTQGGPIALHGTNQPASIGRAVSNGCLRLENGVIERIFDAALAGTPVVIRA
jgi:lipoprotein-anchoring transpeptidase ErfK/SrfK